VNGNTTRRNEQMFYADRVEDAKWDGAWRGMIMVFDNRPSPIRISNSCIREFGLHCNSYERTSINSGKSIFHFAPPSRTA